MATKKTPTKTAKAAGKAPAAKAPAPKAPAAKAAAAKSNAGKPAAAATPRLQDTLEPLGVETMEAVVKAGTQAAGKSYEQTVALFQEQVEKASGSVFQGYDEVAALGKDNIDAYMQSSTLFAKGVEAMGKELMSFAQTSVDIGVANAQALFGAKTVRELIDLQSDMSRSGLDSLVAESAKLTELSMTLANETLEPIQARLNANVEKLLKPLAA
ncbi:phasin family protein [Pelagibius sp. CAU 1746]|uniref:phasin family protein n=1 Tax=Pelagibius sp. CAU 1746 TaxID=3140370 RepID=UPI00325B51B7